MSSHQILAISPEIATVVKYDRVALSHQTEQALELTSEH
jgi:hypothetical protein